MSLPPELLDILVCPKCKGPLEHHEGPPEVLICRSERLVFAVEEGIPIMPHRGSQLRSTRTPSHRSFADAHGVSGSHLTMRLA